MVVMAAPPAPPRIWARFMPEAELHGRTLLQTHSVTHYSVREVVAIRGDTLSSIAPASTFVRIESASELVSGGELAGVTQHVVYTNADQRHELAAISATPSGPCAVLIPIKKSDAWWSLAQDERYARFHGLPSARGHYDVGSAYAARIFRRLYHARYLPGSVWDFLTYFEFPEREAPAFRALLAELRDPAQNPEWEYVEREVEVWMRKLG